MQGIGVEVVRQRQQFSADVPGGQCEQQQIRFERAAEDQARIFGKTLLTQAIGQPLDIAQGIDPAPDEPLTVALVTQRRLQWTDLYPVLQPLQGTRRLDLPFDGVRDGRTLELMHAHWLTSYPWAKACGGPLG